MTEQTSQAVTEKKKLIPTKEEIAALKLQHREIYLLECDDLTEEGDGQLIFKQPSQAQMRHFVAAKKLQETDMGTAYDTMTGLALDFVVYPSREVLEPLLKSRSSLCIEIFERAYKVGSAGVRAGQKKL